MKRASFCALVWAAISLTACGSSEEKTTQCTHSAKKIGDLEIDAASNDRNALRELELCYDFQGDTINRARIHRRRLALKEPEAMIEEAERLINLSRNIKICGDRKIVLSKASNFAMNAARIDKAMDPTQSSTVKLVYEEFARLPCK
jgi:hypothetical protein